MFCDNLKILATAALYVNMKLLSADDMSREKQQNLSIKENQQLQKN